MRAAYWRTGRPLQTLSYDPLEIRPIGPNQSIVDGQYILTGGGVPNRTGCSQPSGCALAQAGEWCTIIRPKARQVWNSNSPCPQKKVRAPSRPTRAR